MCEMESGCLTMRLIDADLFEVYAYKTPPEYDGESYDAGVRKVIGDIDAAPTIEAKPVQRKRKLCTVCGKELPQGSQAKYCDECRANKHKKFCTVCGAEIPKGSKAKYCGDCRLERKREHVKNNHMVELAMQAKRKKAKLKWVWRGDQK